MTTALVLGDSRDVQAEAAKALELFKPDIVVCANLIGVVWKGRVDHWVSYHPENFLAWQDQRAEAKLSKAGTLWTSFVRDAPEGLEISKVPEWAGSSGLLAVEVAIEAGATHIVLAGIPMTSESGTFYDENAWPDAELYRPHWESHMEDLKLIVRSMSGWTKEVFGEPTKAWLNRSHTS